MTSLLFIKCNHEYSVHTLVLMRKSDPKGVLTVITRPGTARKFSGLFGFSNYVERAVSVCTYFLVGGTDWVTSLELTRLQASHSRKLCGQISNPTH